MTKYHHRFIPDDWFRVLSERMIIKRDDPNIRVLFGPKSQEEIDFNTIVQAQADTKSAMESWVTELRELVICHDPVELIPSIIGLSGMAFDSGSGIDLPDPRLIHTQDAMTEYLAGVALTGPPGSNSVGGDVVKKVKTLLERIFDAALLNSTARQFLAQSSAEHVGADLASLLLGSEYLVDRMAGYAVHLQEIADEVFEPHCDFYEKELGFCPSDAIRLVKRHGMWCNELLNNSLAMLHETVNADTKTSNTEEPDEKALLCMSQFHTATISVYTWNSELLAHSSNIPIAQVKALLRSMSIEFGCQPDFKFPSDDNKLRKYPLIRCEDDTYFVPAPWSLAHSVYDWLRDYSTNNPATLKLASRYPRHRSKAAERLVRHSMETVFGKEAVFANQHYECEHGDGEVDCIVVVGSVPILIEVKSKMLSERERRGYYRDVKFATKKIMSKSFNQIHRVHTYISECNGRHFAGQKGASLVRLLPNHITDIVSIVVTLERMDPIVMEAGGHAQRVWSTNLVDFLMVRDILNDPASFLHYAQIRAKFSELGLLSYVETDLLGSYLEDRLVACIRDNEESKGLDRLVERYDNRVEIDNYYTKSELGYEIKKPTTGVPDVLLKALRTCASPHYPPGWVTVSTAVMGALPKTWKAWHRFLRRHKNGHPFTIPGGKTTITASPTQRHAELRNTESIPELAIPYPLRRVS